MKFTKEEIALCKKIAEKNLKEIKAGDDILWAGRQSLVIEVGKKHIAVKWEKSKEQHQIKYRWIELKPYPKLICPLWQISDCLEFFRSKNCEVTLHYFKHRKEWDIQIWDNRGMQAFYSSLILECSNKTSLETCLKAVLAIVEES